MRHILAIVLFASALPLWGTSISYSYDCGTGLHTGQTDKVPTQGTLGSCQGDAGVAAVTFIGIHSEAVTWGSGELFASVTADIPMEFTFPGSTPVAYWMALPKIEHYQPGDGFGTASLGPWSAGDAASFANALAVVPGDPVRFQWDFSMTARNGASMESHFDLISWDANGNEIEHSEPSIRIIDLANGGGTDPAAVPEPGPVGFLSIGLLTIAAMRKRRQNAA